MKPIRSLLQAAFAAVAVFVTVACGSSDSAITSFSFRAMDNPDLHADVVGDIVGKAITANLPFGTSAAGLKPSIAHTGASIKPETGVLQNFASPVEYTVTAEDGTTSVYTVAVTVSKE